MFLKVKQEEEVISNIRAQAESQSLSATMLICDYIRC